MPAPTIPPITTIVASKGPRARLKPVVSGQLPVASYQLPVEKWPVATSRYEQQPSRSGIRSPDQHLLDPQVGRAVRDAVGLRRLPLGVAAGAVHLPLVR